MAQHVDRLADLGVRVREFVPRIEKYAPPPLAGRPRARPVVGTTAVDAAWSVAKLATRLPGVVGSWRSDLTWLQREMLPGFMTLEPFTKRPWVLDIDDAIWLGRDSTASAIARIVRRADVVMAGNDYLASWCESKGAEVRLVPTAVDTSRYRPAPATARLTGQPLVVGWIGTSANFGYLRAIEPALAAFLGSSDAELVVVADRPPVLPSVDPSKLRWRAWSAATEIAAIQAMDIGLMPLGTDEWSEGKCALKMLQYLACQVPALVSPTGMTESVLGRGDLGTALRTEDDWLGALTALREDSARRAAIGAAGRRVVECHYSQEHVAGLIASVLADAANSTYRSTA